MERQQSDPDLRAAYTRFYSKQSHEDQVMLTELLTQQWEVAEYHTERRLRVKILTALGLSGTGNCRHCPPVKICEHGGRTIAES